MFHGAISGIFVGRGRGPAQVASRGGEISRPALSALHPHDGLEPDSHLGARGIPCRKAADLFRPSLGLALRSVDAPRRSGDVPVNDEYALVRKCRQVPLCLKEESPLTLAALLIHHTASDYIYAVVLAVVHG